MAILTARLNLIELTKGLDYSRASAGVVNSDGDALFTLDGQFGTRGRSFVWKRGNLVEIVPKSRRNENCWGMSMNDSCEVVGSIGPGYEQQQPFYWKNGEMIMLPCSGAPVSYAVGINRSGAIVGSIYPDTSGYGVLWKDGKIVDTGKSVSKRQNEFISINDRGDIAGNVQVDGGYSSFIYSGRSVEHLSPTVKAMVSHINKNRIVAGSMNIAARAGSGATSAFVYADKKMRDIGTLSGLTSNATCINDAGIAVGYSSIGRSDDTHAFVWKEGKLTDLNRMMNIRDIVFTNASSINNRGDILCSGISHGKPRVYLITG